VRGGAVRTVDFRGGLKSGLSFGYFPSTSQIRLGFTGATEEYRYGWLGSQQDIVHTVGRTGHGTGALV